MKIMVFDVPAESGGALTILKQYYEKAIKDINNKWYFVISTPDFKETENVKILKYPWIKKSWFHRLYFDYFVAGKIVQEYKIDEVLSLQNVIVNNVKVKQILYLHQPLPFVEKRYKLADDLKFWVYQNIISKMIFHSIKKADKVIVQTKWMKEACLKKVKTNPNKFIVKKPEINIEVKKKYEQENEGCILFFYPASGLVYKNHQLIVQAVLKLKEQNITNYKIVFTLNVNENNNVKELYKIVKNYELPIDFIGHVSIKEVYEYYSKSILIFPSYIETFGLPLLEAKLHESPILASDCVFSHEILDDYDNKHYFNYFQVEELVKLIKIYLY